MGEPALKGTLEDARFAERVRLFVQLDFESEHNFWTGLTLDVSEGGLFVATYCDLAVGTRVTVHVKLPGSDETITAMAIVRWTRHCSDSDDVPPGVGLQFVAIDARALTRIREFVYRVRAPLFFDDEEN